MKKGKYLLVFVLFLMLFGIRVYAEELEYTITIDPNGGIQGSEYKEKIVLGPDENYAVNGHNYDFLKAPEGKGFAGIEMIDKNGDVVGIADGVLLWGDSDHEDMVLKFNWGDLVTDIDLEFEYPSVGESTETPTDEYGTYNYEEQTNKPKISYESEHGFHLEFTEWVDVDSYDEEYEYYSEPFIGTFESGNKYYALAELYTSNNLNYVFGPADSLNIKVNGEKVNAHKIVGYYTLTSITLEVDLSYKVIEGAEQNVSSDADAEFEIDADYGLFEDGGKVLVDEEEVDPSNYDSREGSTIITLKKDYISTLSEGEHTLTVVFADDKTAETTFTVNVNVPEEEPTEEPEEEQQPEKQEETKEETKTEEPPHTGVDASYASVLVLSILGLGGLILSKRID